MDLYRILVMSSILVLSDYIIRNGDLNHNAISITLKDNVHYQLCLNDANGYNLDQILAKEQISYQPQLIYKRDQILYYFTLQKRQQVKEEKAAYFSYKKSIGGATIIYKSDDHTLQLVRDICNTAGYHISCINEKDNSTELELVTRWLLSTANDDHNNLIGGHSKYQTKLAIDYPQFASYRDISFLYHLALIPAKNRFIKLHRWYINDLNIRWDYQSLPMNKNIIYCYARAFDRKYNLTFTTTIRTDQTSTNVFYLVKTAAAATKKFKPKTTAISY